MTVPLQVKICVSRFSIHRCAETSILPGVINISKKGMATSLLWSSAVNCMCWSMELMCSTFSDIIHVYIKLLGKIFSLGPDEARNNLSKACLSQQKNSPVIEKTH